MSIVRHAVIAAAGMGTRLGLGQPKCLIEVAGRPLIAHLLERLAGVEDVRVVTGFMSREVIDLVSPLRRDVIFVQNHEFRSTSTLGSYVLGARGIEAPVLYMDADIYFEAESFAGFLAACRPDEARLAVTRARTEDCVYVRQDARGLALAFSRTERSPMEWANLAWLPPRMLAGDQGAVFERLGSFLPLDTHEITSFEVDTPQDLEALLQQMEGLVTV